MKEELIYKWVAIAAGGIFGYLGGLDKLLTVLITLTVLDYVSGIIAAGVMGKLKSKVGFKGIAKKVMLFLLVAAAHVVDQAIGSNAMFREAVIFFFIANELLSLIENAGNIGLPVPQVLTNAVEILKGKGEGK
ncbi:phage holin family protein [Bacillus massiliigorillae]|uniref:phage holin family protein n=1 Tax=Bacillus massiliigorillae TaxID=1243664 RepID=UPI0003AA951A|nr:phage holin family protein [Bacillus massiliigorillae]